MATKAPPMTKAGKRACREEQRMAAVMNLTLPSSKHAPCFGARLSGISRHLEALGETRELGPGPP